MRIDIIADVICPWCYIGKRRMERAIAAVPGIHFDLYWRPFQLNPAIAPGGRDRAAYLAEKFGGAERAARMYKEVEQAGAGEGIDFQFGQIARTPNTLNAHRVIHFAGLKGAQEPVVEALHRAYFSEGRDIGHVAVLADVAATAGLERAEVLGYIISREDSDTVREDDERARALGVNGVPCFIVDRKFAISGAQSPEVFLQVFDLARIDRQDSEDSHRAAE